MTWAIYGGSFNPPHLGHVQTIGWLLELKEVTGVHVIVTGHPPHKNIDGNDPLKRVAFTQTVVDNYFGKEDVVVDDHEARLTATGYTVDNLKRLHQQYPKRKWAFVMGLDSFLEIQTWKAWQTLAELCQVWVVPRQNQTGYTSEKGQIELWEYKPFNAQFPGMVPKQLMEEVTPPLTVRFLNRIPVAVASRELRSSLELGNRDATKALIPAPLNEDESFYAWYHSPTS